MKFIPCAIAAASLLALAQAQAGTYTYSGDTTNAPTFNRPLYDFSGISGVGTAVHYDVFAFTVDAAGSYSFASATSPTWDNYTLLYQNQFDPMQPLLNGVAGNDDMGGIGNSGFTTALTAGTAYFFITTGFGNSNFGAFTNTISGVGNVIPGVVPEPASYALMGLGLALTGLAIRRRRAG